MKLERVKREKNGKVYRYVLTPEAAAREYQASRDYHERNYDRLTVDVPLGMVEALTKLAQKRGVSRRQLLIELFTREIEKDSTG